MKAFWDKYKVKRDFHNPTKDGKIVTAPEQESDVDMEESEEASTSPYSSNPDADGAPRRIDPEEVAGIMGDVVSPDAFANEVAAAGQKELENARAGLASSSNPAGQPLCMATPHVERPRFWAEPEVDTPPKVKAS